MRIVIGYDGSAGADAAVEDLKRAGLPEKTHALVISVADVLLPPDPPGYHDSPLPAPIADSFKKSEQQARQLIAEAQLLAEKCGQSLRTQFPKWNVETAALADSPPWGILKKSAEWKADLIIVGALGMSSTARLILGSVSQRVVTDAPCSVRVVHHKPKTKSHLRIVIGVDGSEYSERAVDEVCRRKWPTGSEVHLVTVIDSKLITSLAQPDSGLRRWVDDTDVDEHNWVSRLLDSFAKRLRAHGLKVTQRSVEGNPKSAIWEEAEQWGADCIFVGARGLSGLKHFLIGSVSAAVAARAHCTVEVVRSAAS